jgi:hypothetical protein
MVNREEIFRSIVDTILVGIYHYCNYVYYDQSRIESDIEILYKKDTFGLVCFRVFIDVKEKGFMGDYDYPPFSDIIAFVLENATIVTLFNCNGREMRNIKSKLNQLLKESEGSVLKP